jgi:hypothetical protein
MASGPLGRLTIGDFMSDGKKLSPAMKKVEAARKKAAEKLKKAKILRGKDAAFAASKRLAKK